MNILVVGCGNIAFRHLQYLHKNKKIIKIYLLDKKISTTEKFIIKFTNKKKFILIKNIKDIAEKKIKFCILSTLSYNRLKLFETLERNLKIKYWLIEKILESNQSLIKKFNKSKFNKNTYVNIPLTISEIFFEIKKILKKNSIIEISLKKKNWNLGSNAIHFIAFVSKLTQSKIKEIKLVNCKLKKSKHKKFDEIDGQIKVNYSKNFNLLIQNQTKYNSIEFRLLNDRRIIYDFNKNELRYINLRKVILKKIIYRYNSFYTNEVFKKILKRNKLNLPTASEHFSENKKYILSVNNYFKKKIYLT